MSENQNNLNQLITFHLSNELAEIEKTANQTNIFDVLKITSAEIRHSNMLAWLINPQNSHGFGNSILKELCMMALLDDAFYGCFDSPCIKSNKKEYFCFYDKPVPRTELIDTLINGDFSDLKVYREYAHIDVLLVSDKNKFVCVIENKVEANIEETQLRRYAETVCQEYKDYKKLFIILSVYPQNEINCNRYHQITYLNFYKLLQKNYETNKYQITADNKVLIKHYIRSVRRYLMDNGVLKDSDYIQLCKTIYKTHKKAIDDIVKYGRPNLNPQVMKNFYDKTNTMPTNGNYETVNTIQYIIPKQWEHIIPPKSDYNSEKYIAVVSVDLSNVAISDIDGKSSVKMGVHITKPNHDFKALRDNFADKLAKNQQKKVGVTYFTLASEKTEINMGDVFEDTKVSGERIAEKLIELYNNNNIQNAINDITKIANEMSDNNEDWRKECK